MTRNLRTVSQFAESSPFSEASVRWMIHKAGDNGLAAAGAIVRVGRRVYIDAERFDAWLVQQNPGLARAEAAR